MAKRGRPPMPEGDARSEVINVRVTPAELAAITSEAEARGIGVSEVARERLMVPAVQRKYVELYVRDCVTNTETRFKGMATPPMLDFLCKHAAE